MSVSVRRLIAYYQSPDFERDHQILVRNNPVAAGRQRNTIIDHLNDNMRTVGIHPSPTELEVQARFIAGDLSLSDMLEQMQLYVASISLRWLPTP
jgi:hypothetical protein